MHVAILRREKGASFSMDVYADGLVSGLKIARPHWTISEFAPTPFSDQKSIGTRVRKYHERYWRYPRLLARQDIDIFHIIDHSDGHLVSWLRRLPSPTIVTCHDLINLTQPETFRGRAILPFLSMSLWKRAVWGMRGADHLVSVSTHTSKDMISYLRIPPSQITVVPNAVEDKFQVVPREEGATFRQRQGLSPDTWCLLNVGSNHVRKNVIAILKALSTLRDKGLLAHFWKVGADFDPEQQTFIRTHQLEDCVTFLGQPDDQTLVRIYNAADLLVAPSLYEGFGMTVLEAMACGTPVIASNTTSLPEVAGDAAILVPPTDVEALVSAIYRVHADPDLHEQMRLKGLARAKQFTWVKTAEQIAHIYEAAIAVA